MLGKCVIQPREAAPSVNVLYSVAAFRFNINMKRLLKTLPILLGMDCPCDWHVYQKGKKLHTSNACLLAFDFDHDNVVFYREHS